MKPVYTQQNLCLSQQLGFELHLWVDGINNYTLKCPPGLSHHSYVQSNSLLEFPITHTGIVMYNRNNKEIIYISICPLVYKSCESCHVEGFKQAEAAGHS